MLVGGGVVTSLLTLYAMAKVWNRAFWRAAAHRGTPSRTDPRGRSPASSAGDCPAAMVATTVVLVLVGVGLTVVAGPLYGYADRPRPTLSGRPYVRAVLSSGRADDLVGGDAYVRAGCRGGAMSGAPARRPPPAAQPAAVVVLR